MSDITKLELQDAQAFLSDLSKREIAEQIRYITCTHSKPIESIDDLCGMDQKAVVRLINAKIHFNTLFRLSENKIHEISNEQENEEL